MNIQGKHVLITGASYGIGAALARAAAQAGASRVTLLARTQPALEQVAAEARAAGSAPAVYAVDLTDHAAVERTAEQIVAGGAPDILISNAGAGRWLFVDETSPEEAVQMMAMPYFAAFYITRALLPAMLRRGDGHIVYVNSPASIVAWPGATAYTAARWALRGFAEALRADLRGTNIRVSSVIPGKVASSYFEHNPGVLEREPALSRLLIPALTPDQAAARIVRGIERGERTIVIPRMLKLFYTINFVAPGLVRWLAVTTGARRKPGG